MAEGRDISIFDERDIVEVNCYDKYESEGITKIKAMDITPLFSWYKYEYMTGKEFNIYAFPEIKVNDKAEIYEDFYIRYHKYGYNNPNINKSYYRKYERYPYRIDTTYNEWMVAYLVQYQFIQNYDYKEVDGKWFMSVMVINEFDSSAIDYCYVPEYLYRFTSNTGYTSIENAIEFKHDAYFDIHMCASNIRRYRNTKSARSTSTN